MNTDKDTARALNKLAREQMKHRLLTDVRVDMAICEIGGYDKREYINELITLLQSLIE